MLGRTNLGAAILVATIGGCSSSSGPVDAATAGTTDGGFTTSVGGNQVLNALSSSDRSRLCMNVEAFTTDNLGPAECRGYALSATNAAAMTDRTLSDPSLQSTCSQAYDACVASIVDGGATSPLPSDAATGSMPADAGAACAQTFQPDCTGTVAELSSCLSDLAQAYDVLPMCSAVARVSLPALFQDGGLFSAGAKPASCTTLEAKCPEIFSSGSSGSVSSAGATPAGS